MKAGIWVFAITKPFISPRAVPATIPIKIEIITGSPETLKPIANVPDTATIEPIDKSIPPEIITSVIPKASNALVDTCLKMFIPLLTVKNLSVKSVTIIQIAIKPIKIYIFLLKKE